MTHNIVFTEEKELIVTDENGNTLLLLPTNPTTGQPWQSEQEAVDYFKDNLQPLMGFSDDNIITGDIIGSKLEDVYSELDEDPADLPKEALYIETQLVYRTNNLTVDSLRKIVSNVIAGKTTLEDYYNTVLSKYEAPNNNIKYWILRALQIAVLCAYDELCWSLEGTTDFDTLNKYLTTMKQFYHDIQDFMHQNIQ